MPSALSTTTLGRILACQFAVAWAGEGGEDPRLSWWRSVLTSQRVSPLPGGDGRPGGATCRSSWASRSVRPPGRRWPRPYPHESARELLKQRREALAEVLEAGSDGVEFDGDELRWWTFAGGRINATLRHALLAVGGEWEVVPQNHLLTLRGEGIDRRAFDEAIAKIREPGFWENEALWEEVASAMPAYRLSKFQALMPPWVEREVIAAFLLDLERARRWLSGPPTDLSWAAHPP